MADRSLNIILVFAIIAIIAVAAKYVPEATVKRPGFFETLGISGDDVVGFLTCCGFAAFFVGMVAFSIRSTSRRKLEYLPPKLANEGPGIKRGLTAGESAALLQQPMDKIRTMSRVG